jgi:hypothetical protein
LPMVVAKETWRNEISGRRVIWQCPFNSALFSHNHYGGQKSWLIAM